MEIPGGWGSKAKLPSVGRGGMDIFGNYTLTNAENHFSLLSLSGFDVLSMHSFSLMAVTFTDISISSGFSEPVFITIVL